MLHGSPTPEPHPLYFLALCVRVVAGCRGLHATYCMLLTFHYPSTMNVYCKVVLVLVVMVMVVVIRAVWC